MSCGVCSVVSTDLLPQHGSHLNKSSVGQLECSPVSRLQQLVDEVLTDSMNLKTCNRPALHSHQNINHNHDLIYLNYFLPQLSSGQTK